LNIVFAGTPEFAVASLKALHESKHQVIAVYTQPDRPAGRGRKTAPSPVKQFATAHTLPVFQPPSLKTPEAVEELRALAPDIMVVVAYGLLLPETVLNLPTRGCINVHASLLPRWRGAAPIQRAIEAGDACTGVTIMQMDKGLDTGDMIIKCETPIEPNETAGQLHDRLASIGAQALLEALDLLERNAARPVKQDEREATYARKLEKAEAQIDWATDAQSLARRVRAFNPWPAAASQWQGKRLKFLEAGVHPGPCNTPGTVHAVGTDSIDICTGDGLLAVTRLQLEGGKPLAAAEFINGHALRPGDRLGQ